MPADTTGNEHLYAFNKQRYGDVIRKYRLKRGLSQLQLAAATGVKKNAISNWEAGRSRPDINCLPALCRALRITPSRFFQFCDIQHEPLCASEHAMLRNYRALSEGNQSAVRGLIAALADTQAQERSAYLRRSTRKVFLNSARTAAGWGQPLGDRVEGEYIHLFTDPLVDRADEIITVTGDSMLPTYRDGDDLLVEHTSSLSPGEIGIFVANGAGYVKEYQPDGLHSHNPDYPVLRFGENDDVRCVGRVLGVVRPEQIVGDADLALLEETKQ